MKNLFTNKLIKTKSISPLKKKKLLKITTKTQEIRVEIDHNSPDKPHNTVRCREGGSVTSYHDDTHSVRLDVTAQAN